MSCCVARSGTQTGARKASTQSLCCERSVICDPRATVASWVRTGLGRERHMHHRSIAIHWLSVLVSTSLLAGCSANAGDTTALVEGNSETIGQTSEALGGCSDKVTSNGWIVLNSGFFFYNGGGYYANATLHYCLIDSWPQWRAAHGPVSQCSTFESIPPAMTYDGECRLPAGFFFNNGTGYYANSSGHYCGFTSWAQWVGAGGPRSGAPTFVPIPSSMVYDGVCH